MWDERVIEAIIRSAREDLRAQKCARDFADKLKERNIATAEIDRAIANANAIVLYRHHGFFVIGFYHERSQILAVWSPRQPSRWVTSFRRPEGLRYLLRAEDAELIWLKR